MDLNHRITGLQAVPLNSRAHLHDNASISDTLNPVGFKCNNKKYNIVKFVLVLLYGRYPILCFSPDHDDAGL